MNALPEWRRMVIKVGSSLVAPDGGGCSTRYLLAIAQFVIAARDAGRQVIIVSSGSVAAGRATRDQYAARGGRSIAEKQALAAIGQSQLLGHWQQFFDFQCAQVLLTRDDIADRKRFLNAKNTLTTLLSWDVLPVVNENDTVAIDELKLGDNDNLAAHVAVLADADILLILSDVDGLFDADPNHNQEAQLIPQVPRIDASIRALAGAPSGPLGTGGMRTKIEAAEIATGAGVDSIILSGVAPEPMLRFARGENSGTWFHASSKPVAARKHWMLHSREAVGQLVVDAGACRALTKQGASLLPSGIQEVRGQFRRGDVLEIVGGSSNRCIARGMTQYNAEELQEIKGRHSRDIAELLGYCYTDVVVHRNDLVITDD